MFSVHAVGAAVGGECFLLKTGRGAALIDTGFSYCGEKLVRNVEKALDGETLEAILLTHSHYDHASGTAACLKRWPDAKVVASKYAAYIFTRPSARKLMLEMNQNAAAVGGCPQADCDIGEIPVSLALSEGEEFTVGGLRFLVLETPGHTKCSISFWCPEEKLLIACETIGLLSGPGMAKPNYLVGYRMTIDSIRKVLALDPEDILLSHTGLLQGEDNCREFLINSLYWAQELRRRILDGYKAGATVEELTDRCIALFSQYDKQQGKLEKAIRLNASITVPMLIREYLSETETK